MRNLGIATSTEVGEFIDKNIRNVIKGLKQLVIYGEVRIIIFQSDQHRKKLYVTNDVYNNLCKTSE